MARLHVKVEGRVQGVGFRWFARVAARRHQLAGWVVNRPDGSVEVAAEGPEDKLTAFRAALSRGPDGAEVSRVTDLAPLNGDPLEFPFKVDKAGGRRALNEA